MQLKSKNVFNTKERTFKVNHAGEEEIRVAMLFILAASSFAVLRSLLAVSISLKLVDLESYSVICILFSCLFIKYSDCQKTYK